MSGRVVSGTRAGLGPDRTDRDTRTQATQTKITRNAGNGVASRRLTATLLTVPFTATVSTQAT